MTNAKIFVITHKEFNMINAPSKGRIMQSLPTDSLWEVTNLNKIDESC